MGAPNYLKIHGILIMLDSSETLTHSYVRSDRPGPNSAELLTHHQHRESNANAQISWLTRSPRKKTKVHFCGPTGGDAVDAAVKLCQTATGPLSSRIPTTVEG
jgi:hypothetical protein